MGMGENGVGPPPIVLVVLIVIIILWGWSLIELTGQHLLVLFISMYLNYRKLKAMAYNKLGDLKNNIDENRFFNLSKLYFYSPQTPQKQGWGEISLSHQIT
jgi:hypothetical protein